MPKGVLWCAYIKRNIPENKLAAEMSDMASSNQPQDKEKELKSIFRMNIEQAHAILGHSSEDITCKTAVALNIQITRGSLKTCEPCAIAKAKQMNVNSESEGAKAETFNGRVFHDIAIVKESKDDKKLGRKSVWHVCSEETVLFKTSKFFVSKS
jgi:hypothetical protein